MTEEETRDTINAKCWMDFYLGFMAGLAASLLSFLASSIIALMTSPAPFTELDKVPRFLWIVLGVSLVLFLCSGVGYWRRWEKYTRLCSKKANEEHQQAKSPIIIFHYYNLQNAQPQQTPQPPEGSPETQH